MSRYSIILPVRNGGEYARQCISSILTQSYADFTLHVLDNCSTDGTVEWINTLGDKRIVLIKADAPLTIEESWGRIVNIEKNEFISLIGHDDLLDVNYLAVMDALIQKYPSASLYQAHFRLIDSEGNEIRKCKPMREKEETKDFLSSVLRNEFDVFGTGFMMRANDYDRLGGIPAYPNLLFADFELWVKLTMISFKATAVAECFSYRIHQSTTKTSTDSKMQEAFIRFIKYVSVLKHQDEQLQKVIDQDANGFLLNYCKGLSHRLLRTSLNQRKGLTVEHMVNQCKELAMEVLPTGQFKPEDSQSIRLAKFIDSNPITRTLFLWFKKIYSKPVLK